MILVVFLVFQSFWVPNLRSECKKKYPGQINWIDEPDIAAANWNTITIYKVNLISILPIFLVLEERAIGNEVAVEECRRSNSCKFQQEARFCKPLTCNTSKSSRRSTGLFVTVVSEQFQYWMQQENQDWFFLHKKTQKWSHAGNKLLEIIVKRECRYILLFLCIDILFHIDITSCMNRRLKLLLFQGNFLHLPFK